MPFTWWNPLTYFTSLFHFLTFGHFTFHSRFKRQLNQRLKEEADAFRDGRAKHTFVKRVRQKLLQDIKKDIQTDTHNQITQVLKKEGVSFWDRQTMRGQLKEELNSELNGQALSDRFEIAEPIFIAQIQEFIDEFSEETEVIIDDLFSKHEQKFDDIWDQRREISMGEIKDRYENVVNTDEISNEFERRANELYGRL